MTTTHPPRTLTTHTDSPDEPSAATGRLRWVDFVRAASLTVVVLGHYLMALVLIGPARPGSPGEFTFTAIPDVATWSHPLTWVLQVMPCFFAVGAVVTAQRHADAPLSVTAWRNAMVPRVRALLIPALPLLLVWWAAGPLLAGAVGDDLAIAASQAAVVPLWFLAVYLLVQAAMPIAVHAVRRWGVWPAVAVLILAAALVDSFHLSGVPVVGWLNFPLVWMVPTVLGCAVGLGQVSRRQLLRVGLGALGSAVLLVVFLGYPVPVVGVTDAVRSNNSPPSLLLGVHALAYSSLVLGIAPSLERILGATPRRRRTLKAAGTWSMALYLWHMTALVTLIGLAVVLPVPGLDQLLALQPLSGMWWLFRPVFLLITIGVALGLITLVTPVTRRLVAWSSARAFPGPGRTAVATLCASAGISTTVLSGTASVPVFSMLLVGAAVFAIRD